MEFKELDEKEILILEMIKDATEPIGSWNIVNRMAEEQIDTSSATIGRLLNRLESMGYLKKEKFRGRVITKKGLHAIAVSKQLKSMAVHQNKLNRFVEPQLLEDFLAVLEARRTVESGTARLAALRCTAEEIEHMDRILTSQENKYKEQKWITSDDLEFHKTIAKASKNPILETIYHQLAILGQQSMAFEYIRKKINAEYMVSHRRILDAIRAGNPEEAEAAMLAHIDSLVSDVNKYWETCLNENNQDEDDGNGDRQDEDDRNEVSQDGDERDETTQVHNVKDENLQDKSKGGNDTPEVNEPKDDLV